MSEKPQRNYRAMDDVKLFRCYWELRNGLFKVGSPRRINNITHNTSCFGTTAYEICTYHYEGFPLEDCVYIEELATMRGLKLNGVEANNATKMLAAEQKPSAKERRQAQGKNIRPLDPLEPPEYEPPESDMIEI